MTPPLTAPSGPSTPSRPFRCPLPCHAGPSTSATLDLPPLESLLSWVHRPIARAKCHVSDLYAMSALLPASQSTTSYASRELFLLDRFPCKMVELVGWVAGVDNKESSMTITLDDGSDQVLPVLVRLTAIKPPLPPFKTSKSLTGIYNPGQAPTTRSSFASARERIAKRQVQALAEAEAEAEQQKWKTKTKAQFGHHGKVYERKDIRVGDTVRIVGRVDEWQRRKAAGDVEWVRQVCVEEGAGGSVAVVDPDMQYFHTAQVYELHRSTYSRPFEMPESTCMPPPRSQPLTPSKSLPRSAYPADTSGWSIEPSSEMSEAPSELSMVENEPELRDPSRLRSSQLTDRTFRHYMLDHMTQQTVRATREIAADGIAVTRATLETFFPEYRLSNLKGKGKDPSTVVGMNNGVFAPSTRYNSVADDEATPTRSRPRPRTSFGPCKHIKPTVPTSTPTPTPLLSITANGSTSPLRPFTIPSLLSDDRLSRLARLVVENELRKEEKRRRRRIRDGQATKKDLAVEKQRLESGSGVGREWLESLGEEEKRGKMERLVKWVIRGVAEEGGLVQVRLSLASLTASNGHEEGSIYGYFPLPPELLLPLLLPHLEEERERRKKTIRRKGDPRSSNGMTVDELVTRLRAWGEEGRWERVGDWIVEDAVRCGAERGWLVPHGAGWWVADGH